MRGADGAEGSGAGAALATAAVLGLQPLRTPFLDHIRLRARREAAYGAGRDTGRDHTGSDGAEAGRGRRVGRSPGNRRRQGKPQRPAPLIQAMSRRLHLNPPTDDDDLEDDDLDDEDEDVEDDDEEEEEETWQVRSTRPPQKARRLA